MIELPVRPDSEYDNQQPVQPQPVVVEYINPREAQERADIQASEDWLVSLEGRRVRESAEEAAIKARSDYVHSDQYARDVDRYQESEIKKYQAEVVEAQRRQQAEERQQAAETILPSREPFFVDAPGQEEYAARVTSGLPQPTVSGKPGVVDEALEAGATRIGQFGADVGASSQRAKAEGRNLEAGALFMGAAGVGVGAAVFDATTFLARPKAWGETAAFGAALVADPGKTAGFVVADFMTNPGFKLGYWGANVALAAHAGLGVYERIKAPKVGAVEIKGVSLEKVGTKTVDWDMSVRPVEGGPLSKTPQFKGLSPDVEFGTQTDIFRVTVDRQPFTGEIPRNALKNPDILAGVLKESGGGVTLERNAIIKGLEYSKIKAGKPFISDDVRFATFDKPTSKAPGTVTEFKGYGDAGSVAVVPEAKILGAGDLLGVKNEKIVITKASDYRVDFDVGTKMVEVTGPKVVKPAEWTVKMFEGEPGLIQSKPAVIDWNAPKGKVEVPTITSKIVRASELGVDVNAEVAPLMGEAFKVDIKGFAQSAPPEPSLTPFRQLIKKTSWDRTNVKAWRSEIPYVMDQAAKVGASKPPSMPTLGASAGGSGGAPMLSLTDVAVDISPIILTGPSQPSIAASTFSGLGVVQAFKGHALEPVFPEFPMLDIKPPILDVKQPSRQKPVTYPKLAEQFKTRTPPETKPPEFKLTLKTPVYQEPKPWITQPPRITVREKTDITQEPIETVINIPFKWSPPPTQARLSAGLPFPPGFGAGGFGGSIRYRKRIQRVPLPTMNDIMRRMKF